MPKVNFIREHTRFMEYATDEHLTASERLLWYALMHIMNQRAQGNIWPDEFIRISNDRLLSYSPMKYDTMAAARNSLKQRGLIEFMKGEKNKLSPAYRMIYFYPEYVAPKTDEDEGDEGDEEGDIPRSSPKKTEYIGGNMGGNSGGNTGGNHGGNSGDFNINYNGNPIQDGHMGGALKKDKNAIIKDLKERMRTSAREEARKEWAWGFGKEPTPATVEALSEMIVQYGFYDGALKIAIREAATAGIQRPVEYIMKCLKDWGSQYLLLRDDIEEYLELQYALGHHGGTHGSWDEADKELNELLTRVKREHSNSLFY